MANATREDLGAFDYVIVGAGSAGAVLANRLSANPGTRVCLLEAGGPDTSALIHVPMGFALQRYWKNLNWRFETVPQKHLNNRTGYQPRGRVLGGSSCLNAMIYIRGTRHDYDRWRDAGADGWGWDDVLPYFKKAENNERGADAYHGVGGPLNVADRTFKNPLTDVFLDAATQCQLPSNSDFNGADQEGVGYFQFTQKNGERFSTAKAYIDPARDRENLTILTGAHAERVVFDGKRAVGVDARINKRLSHIRASKEVILSAGAFQSPQLLLLSGIGPVAHLKQQGIEVVAESEAVGDNLQDHLDWTAIHKAKTNHTVGINWPFLSSLPGAVNQWRKDRKGILTSNIADCGGFLKTDPNEDEPDIQLHFLPAMVDDHGRKDHFGGGISCHVCVLRPKSRGTVRLASPDPMAPPEIDPNFLSDQDDLNRMMKGARMVEKILAAPAFADTLGERFYSEPGCPDAELEAHIRERSDTIYHPVGTCAIGSVVDPQLRVKGVEGLRVADASVMPLLISGNTNAPSIMIGEKASDMIRAA